MKFGVPWSFKGIRPEARETASEAARRSGVSLGEWLNAVIIQQAEQEGVDRTRSNAFLLGLVDDHGVEPFAQRHARTARRFDRRSPLPAVSLSHSTGHQISLLAPTFEVEAKEPRGLPWNRHALTTGRYGRGPQSSARLFAGHGKQGVKDWTEVSDFACGFRRIGGRRRLNGAVSRMRHARSPQLLRRFGEIHGRS